MIANERTPKSFTVIKNDVQWSSGTRKVGKKKKVKDNKIAIFFQFSSLFFWNGYCLCLQGLLALAFQLFPLWKLLITYLYVIHLSDWHLSASKHCCMEYWIFGRRAFFIGFKINVQHFINMSLFSKAKCLLVKTFTWNLFSKTCYLKKYAKYLQLLVSSFIVNISH